MKGSSSRVACSCLTSEMDGLAIAAGEEELFAGHLDDVQVMLGTHMPTLCLVGARPAGTQ